MSATDHTAPKPDLRDAWPAAIAVLLLAAALLHMATYWYYTVEDAYISFRYAENFARGQGLTYNPGERIEGFSNLLWVLILGGTAASGCDELPLAAKVIGASAGLAVIAVTVWIAWLLLPVARWLALVPGIMLAVNPSFAVWSQAGLETPLYTLWLILACVPLVTATPGWRHGVISGLLWGMALATRPEAPLYLLAVCLPLVFHRRQTWRLLTGLAVGFMAVALPVEVFRIGYFGDVVPNTYHVKSTRFQGGGWRYLLTSLRMTGIGPLAVAPFAPLLRHRARWAGWSCLLAMSLPAA